MSNQNRTTRLTKIFSNNKKILEKYYLKEIYQLYLINIEYYTFSYRY